MRDFVLLISIVSACRESVCRRRRRSSVYTVWSKCTPWDIQLSYCLGLKLSSFQETIQTAEWFFDGSEACESVCAKPSVDCLQCWTKYISSLEEFDMDKALLIHCIGKRQQVNCIVLQNIFELQDNMLDQKATKLLTKVLSKAMMFSLAASIYPPIILSPRGG